MKLSRERANHLFVYDPAEPFALRWRNPPKFTARAKAEPGKIAGGWHETRARSGVRRRVVIIDGNRLPVANIVWLLHSGEWPYRVAFSDGNPGDCRVENLVPPMTREQQAVWSRRTLERWRHGATGESIDEIMRGVAVKRYGLTRQEYDRILAGQRGVCAICGRQESAQRNGKPFSLAVDHCHAGKGVRGLLCSNCNNGLGRFEDNPVLLRAAADYIEHHQAPCVPGSG